MKRHLRWSLIALAAFILDRFLKHLAYTGAHAGDGILKFELFRNGGIAFSLPFSGPLVWTLSVGILIAVCLMAMKDVKLRHDKRTGGYLLFVIGAYSNLFDRVVYGYTIDYLILFHLSAVNIADGMIIAGALWLLYASPKKQLA